MIEEGRKVRVLFVVEDEPEIQALVEAVLSADPRFEMTAQVATAAEAIERSRVSPPDLIILDHEIEGDVMGLEAAPQLKLNAPDGKIILFTAYDHLRVPALNNPAIDAFLLKTNLDELLPLSQALVDLTPFD